METADNLRVQGVLRQKMEGSRRQGEYDGIQQRNDKPDREEMNVEWLVIVE